MDKEDIELGEDYIRSTEKGLEKLILACKEAIKEGSYMSEDFPSFVLIEKVDKSFFEREYNESIKDKLIIFFFSLIFFGSLIVGFITILSYLKKLF